MLVASVLPILGLFQVFDGWTAITGGILRAKGQQVPIFCCYFFFFSKLLNINFTFIQSLGALLNLR